MFTSYLRAIAERAAKTFCQTLAVALGAGATDLLAVGWRQALTLAASAAILSVLTSVGSSSIGTNGPSLIGETLDGK